MLRSNTRTRQFGVPKKLKPLVFMIKYLRTLGFNVVNDVYAENSWYFRNALVRANYSDLTNGITETTEYLERFFRSMLLGEEHDLRNRIMHVDWNKVGDETISQSANHEVQSAKVGEEFSQKCNFCTLEEIALLRIVQKNPSATQKRLLLKLENLSGQSNQLP